MTYENKLKFIIVMFLSVLSDIQIIEVEYRYMVKVGKEKLIQFIFDE